MAPIESADRATFDWTGWSPQEVATLVFIVRDGQILLIRKKRGIGAGKINGPGGRVEDGEDALACAAREFEEELLTRPLGLVWAGDLRFQFTSGFSMLVHVYRGDGVEGEPCETEEASPMWVNLGEIPYDAMWADDRFWMPRMLRRETFRGSFILDDDRLVHHFFESGDATG